MIYILLPLVGVMETVCILICRQDDLHTSASCGGDGDCLNIYLQTG